MTEDRSWQQIELPQWWQRIAEANRSNILCHCNACNYEWVTSTSEKPCRQCGSDSVETIVCWQFPDD
jgi:hypothetical protein